MTRIAAISVQTVTRLPAARAAAPVAARAVEVEKPAETVRRDPTPAVPAVSAAAMATLIAAQARGDDRHEDERPERGGDDERGHKPPVSGPPSEPPPAPQPPVTRPPVTQPPVATPSPAAAAPVPVDLMIPARTIAMIDRRFAEEAVSEAERSAFVAASAERRAVATVAQGQAALAILQATQADMASFRNQAIGRYEAVRRSTYG